MNNFLLIVAIPIFFTSCNNNQFKIASEFVMQQDDSENKIITTYEVNYDPENIDWDQYRNHAISLDDNKISNCQIYYFNKRDNTPSLDMEYSIIDSNFQPFCLAKYSRSINDTIFIQYPFKIELGIADIIMNEDSSYEISVYAISPLEIAGYQVNFAPTNIFEILSVSNKNKSGEYGFEIYNTTNLVLSFSFHSFTIPVSNSREIKDNLLYTVNAKCINNDKLHNMRYYLDAVFSDKYGKALKWFNKPYNIVN